MNKIQLEARIKARGKEFFTAVGKENPSVFNKGWWVGKVMDWSMKNEDFKVQLFRFIDVLPYLKTEEALGHHIREYFGKGDSVPAVLRLGAKSSALGGKLGMKVLGKTIRKNLETMARLFIVGSTEKDTVKSLKKLRDQKYTFTLDILGEATITEGESDSYVATYLELLDSVAAAQEKWQPHGKGGDGLDWGSAPKCNISIKPSALYSLADVADFEGTLAGMLERIKPVYRKVVEMGGFMCIDIEHSYLRDITIELYKRLRGDKEFRCYPHLGLALQCYLKDHEEGLDGLLAWARRENLPISIRLVKGAYWDYEVVIAHQCGWDVPVYTVKSESDVAYENAVEKIFANQDICHLACASHNVRSIVAVMEMAKAMKVPEDRYEFQVLHGMAEPFRKALLKLTDRVRLYCPHGEMLPGMAYLIRRLLENTSNESFVRQTFVDGVEMDRLLEDPKKTLARAKPARAKKTDKAAAFRNEPMADLSLAKTRKSFSDAIAGVKKQLGKLYPLYIDGKDVTTKDVIDSVNPADPDVVIGKVCQAGKGEIDRAMAAAEKAFIKWRNVPPRERAEYLHRAAAIARKRIYELCAWQILEAGKQWRQAYNDVLEAIDFLDYYAEEMVRLGTPRRLGNAPGELNHYFYQPKGLAAVISPWNFPLAISCGMVSGAIVAGNCVVFKPSNQSPVIGYNLKQILEEAGLPPGVFNYCPGRGSVMGDYLVDHPKIALIAFTGSMEVGLRIIERAGVTPPDQPSVKRVVCEMGGKNGLIVDNDADLDQAIPAIMDSAFTYQGQKCSACSRVIVVEGIYDRFTKRLVEAAASWKIGPAEDPSCKMGAVIDASAQKSILEYARIAKKEGKLLFEGKVPAKGYYCPITIVGGVTPKHRIAQEEVFGPVLAVMKAKDFDQAIEWANSTRFALTGGVFTRSPEHIELASREFRIGNLYINRGITGALVERQPFGGFKMSGVGSKAGGPDYLLQFMDPRTVTENTMRRGFVPLESDDRWV